MHYALCTMHYALCTMHSVAIQPTHCNADIREYKNTYMHVFKYTNVQVYEEATSQDAL